MPEKDAHEQSDIQLKPKPTLEQGISDALAVLSKNEKVVEAMATLLNSIAAKPAIEKELRLRTHYIGICFSALVFIGVGVMGYLKVIPTDGTMGLLGALIGYWYGQNKR